MKRGPPPPIDGLSWPVTGVDEEGKQARSTQTTGKEILAVALEAVDASAAAAVRSEKGWRFKYRRHFVKSVEVSASSPEAALKVAAAGLDYMYDKFEFIRDGKTYVLRDALAQFKGSFATGFIKGNKPKPNKFELEVPYNGQILKGDSLQRQIDKWVRQGVCELSCGSAISQVASAEPWLDLSDRYFVLLGAGAAMGPFQVLLALGANIIAVDIGRPDIWKRLISQTKDSCGTLTFPMKPGFKQPSTPDDSLYEAAGCNLFTQTPEIKNWLREVTPSEKACVGGYAYIPGDLFPRVALAMDVIIKELVETRGASVAFLCTPTDAHLVPPAAHAAAKAAIKKAPLWQKMANLVSMGKWCVPNARKPITTSAGETLYVVDALVVPQGPNYALAKRMQHWRAMLAREAGVIVSSNVAPSTRTYSVMQNKLFSYGYATMHHFKPFEIPGPELSNSVMTALLIHDLNEPMHAGNPKMPLVNPQQIFSQGSFHGGAWRCAFTFDSIGAPSVLLYYVINFVVKYYLAAYNALQTIGWAYVLYLASSHYFLGGVPGASTAWEAFGSPLFLFQNLAGLEVAHAATGMVRAGFATTLLQVFSRFAIVYIMAYTAAIQDSWPLQPTVFAWSITEVVRYSWYALNLLGVVPAAHTWLRFTTFLPLYPLGVFGEMATMHVALPSAAGTLVLGLPIEKVTYYLIFPMWVAGLALLYTHMLSQRKKVLAKAKAHATKNKDA